MATTSPCAAPSPSLRCPLALSHPFASPPPPPALRLAGPKLLPGRLAVSPPPGIPAVASALESLILDLDDDEEDEDEETEFGLFQGEAWAAADEREAVRSPELVVPELEELPEQWRRSRIAWLCKELPAYKHSTFTRILNAQRKWITQDDATYVAVHCLRIRNNDAAFRVYSWMVRQHWFRFNFALATRVADCLGRDGKVEKCREVFEAMVKQGRVPAESTFHILIVAYLSVPKGRCLEEACTIYNQMIQMGGYKPRLSLHNSLFRALVSKTGGTAKYNLKQAEFVYHNVVTTNLDVHKDVYAGLIWLHSYQDVIDRERIIALRKEMKQAGFDEGIDVLVSVMRAFSKEGNVAETEATWHNILQSGSDLPVQAYVCRMEAYARTGEPMKSLDMFKEMKDKNIPPNVASYHKIIEIMTKAREVDIVEQLMNEFIESDMKHLMPAFLDLMYMYMDLDMHEKLELTFLKCIARCRPNRILYTIYLESLVKVGNIEKAEEVFGEMHNNGMIGTNTKSCNIMLRGYLSAEDYQKAEKVYDMMSKKKYDVQADSLEKLQSGLLLNKKVIKPKTVSMKLDQEQREILIGLLLGGTRMESYAQRGVHIVHFQFQEDSNAHSVLRVHIHERFFEWLSSASRSFDDGSKIPYQFSTIPHQHFSFFADQFFLKGQPVLPKLIHRWLTPRVLAYWFMFGGSKLPSGDIVLKLSGGNSEGVERIVNSLHTQSLTSKVKRKGRFFWIGFQGSNAESFWRIIEPHVLNNFASLVTQEGSSIGSDGTQDTDTDSDDDMQMSDTERDE
uniref:Protein ORGANELLE TRANSCRIPT PROCESSING 51 n=1 Tax=Oryza nivara TaxID=4536 RepID=A0A0E0GBS4_ORYNI